MMALVFTAAARWSGTDEIGQEIDDRSSVIPASSSNANPYLLFIHIKPNMIKFIGLESMQQILWKARAPTGNQTVGDT